ncbi:MAG: type 4a pilus biogenesis protein PilO [Planctomycetota bacterium]|nr:type 4a pilus biogenesis protein PilO [Planctomycetota bacterium]
MNGPLDRQLLAQLIIIVAVCAGGWMAIVQPQIDELHELQATITRARNVQTSVGEGTIEQMADELTAVRDRFRTIRARNDFADDSTRIYGLIMDLADEHGVTVQRLNPGADQRAADEEEAVHLTTLDITVEGTYEQVARFLEAVGALDGFIRPMTLTITPRQDENRSFVEARFACQALRFALPEALTALVGEDHADE